MIGNGRRRGGSLAVSADRSLPHPQQGDIAWAVTKRVSRLALALFCACKGGGTGTVDAGAPNATSGAATSTVSALPSAMSTVTATATTTAPGPTATSTSTANNLQSETTQWLAAVSGFDAGTAPLLGDKSAPAFRKLAKVDEPELARILSSVPELAHLGKDVRLFTLGDANAIAQKGREEANGVLFSEKPILWAPEPGAEVLVITGRNKSTGFIIALYPNHSGDPDTYRLASFMMMPGDLSPVVLAYRPERRRELFWTSCWGCAAEQGGVSYRDDKRVVIVQY